MTRITEDSYWAAAEGYQGWCPDCAEFTRDMTEPDIEDYDCPDCGGRRVHGAEQALLVGLIDIEGGES